MDRSDVCTLVAYARSQDAYGVWQDTKTEREVFCSVESITRTEFFDGGRIGLNPDLKFTLFYPDYQGEEEVVYDGAAYGVYRTFHAKTDEMELYVERKGGVNVTNGEDDDD